jgi:hypothetical protein
VSIPSQDKMEYTEQDIAGLKQAIGKQSNMRKSAEKKLEEMNHLFAQSIGAMFELDVETDKIATLIWEYVAINELWWKGQSHEVHIYSRIGDYTNKRGETFKAHFTQNGKYLCKDSDGVPKSYEGYFRINKDDFVFDLYVENDKWVLKFESTWVD